MSVWKPNETQQNHLARTQSSGAIWKGILWVVGGHTLDLDFPLTMAFNISGKNRNKNTSYNISKHDFKRFNMNRQRVVTGGNQRSFYPKTSSWTFNCDL